MLIIFQDLLDGLSDFFHIKVNKNKSKKLPTGMMDRNLITYCYGINNIETNCRNDSKCNCG